MSISGRITRRRFITGLVAAPILAGLYTWRVEPTWLEIATRDLPIVNLPPALEGKTLAHFSDIHIGKQVDPDYLADTFRRVAALQPDIVVHTGDLVTFNGAACLAQADQLMPLFPRGPLGTYAILGNHDYGRDMVRSDVAEKISAVLTRAGCRVLRNESLDCHGLRIVGCDDLWAGRFLLRRALTGITPEQPALALCHNPDCCDAPGWENFRGWILAGHTHGGQCKPPFLTPPLLPVQNRRYTAGAFELTGGRQLYISRGVGHLLRVRFNVRPEVALFTLRRAADAGQTA